MQTQESPQSEKLGRQLQSLIDNWEDQSNVVTKGAASMAANYFRLAEKKEVALRPILTRISKEGKPKEYLSKKYKADPMDLNGAGEEFHSNASGDEKPDDENEEYDRERYLDEGRAEADLAATAEQRAADQLEIPFEVAEVISANSWVFRKAWTRGYHPALQGKLDMANHLIQELNRKAGRKPSVHMMRKELLDVIAAVRASLVLCVQESDVPRCNQLACDAAKTAFSSRNIVNHMGLTWNYVLSPEASQLLDIAFQAAETTLDEPLRTMILGWRQRDMEALTAVQRSVVRPAVSTTQSVFDTLGTGKIDEAKNHVATLDAINSQLVVAIRSAMIVDSNHAIPTDALVKSINEYALDTTDLTPAEVSEHLASFFAAWSQFFMRTGFDDIYATLGSMQKQNENFQEALKHEIGEEANQLIKEVRESLKNPINRSADVIDVTDMIEEPDESLFLKDEGNDAPSPNASAESRSTIDLPQTQAQTTQMNSPHSTATSTDPAVTSQPQAATKLSTNGFVKRTVSGPIINNRITELGEVVGSRKVGIVGSCHIVNVGTRETPVHRCFPGGDFGRGVGEQFVKHFELPSAKDLKEKRAIHLDTLDSVVQLETLSTKRAPITYVQVTWKKDASKLEASRTEWLTRSELHSVCGKIWADRKISILIDDWRSNLAYLAETKQKALHPDTGKPLQESDRDEMPWLSPSLFVLTNPDKKQAVKADPQATPQQDSVEHNQVKRNRFGAKMED